MGQSVVLALLVVLQEVKGMDVPSLCLCQKVVSSPAASQGTAFTGTASFSAHRTKYLFVDSLAVVTVGLKLVQLMESWF